MSDAITDLASSAYNQLADRLRLNFVVAVWTNILFVVILVASAAGAAVFMAMGEVVPAAILGGLSIVDLAYGIAEKPWKELLTANNRLALAQSVWIGYVDAKQAINEGLTEGARPAVLGKAQNLWIFRTAVIAQDSYEAVVNELRNIDGHYGPEFTDGFESQTAEVPEGATNGHAGEGAAEEDGLPPGELEMATSLEDLLRDDGIARILTGQEDDDYHYFFGDGHGHAFGSNEPIPAVDAIGQFVKQAATKSSKRAPVRVTAESTDWIGAAQQAYREGSGRTNTG